MSEKLIVHKVPDEVQKQSIETLKVRKETLEYLRNNGFYTILDVIERQNEIPRKSNGCAYRFGRANVWYVE